MMIYTCLRASEFISIERKNVNLQETYTLTNMSRNYESKTTLFKRVLKIKKPRKHEVSEV